MAGPVRIIPLGGLGEVGKNMTAFEYGGRMILIDAGLSFPRAELLGIDLVLPDFSYVAEHADSLDAVILTHGHEDHIGALPYLFREIGTQAAVWGTRLTLGLVKSKLDEHGLLVHSELVEIDPEGGRTRVGPFEAEFVRVTHSVPDAVAVVLHSEHGPDRAHGRLQARRDADRRAQDRPRPAAAARRRRALRSCWPTRPMPSAPAGRRRSGPWARRCATSSARRRAGSS